MSRKDRDGAMGVVVCQPKYHCGLLPDPIGGTVGASVHRQLREPIW